MPWIAGQLGHQRDVRGAQRVLIACLDRGRDRLAHKGGAGRDEPDVSEVGTWYT